MTKRRVATWKFFSGETELENVRWFHVGPDGRPDGLTRDDGHNAQFGNPRGAPRVIDPSISHTLESRADWLQAERKVRFLTKPNPHQCDWRCLGAKPGGQCWCECGGRNHGRNYVCEMFA